MMTIHNYITEMMKKAEAGWILGAYYSLVFSLYEIGDPLPHFMVSKA